MNMNLIKMVKWFVSCFDMNNCNAQPSEARGPW